MKNIKRIKSVVMLLFLLSATQLFCGSFSVSELDNDNRRIAKIHKDLINFDDIDSSDLSYLNLSRNRIKSLEGLKKFSEIDTLILDCMSIDDLNGIKNLKSTEHLSLASNEITDIRFLNSLKNLKYLDLRGNNIKDISPLSKLHKLEELYLDDNLIEDISPLRKLKKLRVLSLNHNNIRKISVKMKNRRLQKLSAAFNDIEDIYGISSLTELIDVNLQNNNIKDISTLGNNPELLYVWLDNNRINSIKPLLKCKKMLEIWVNNNPVEDIKSLSSLDSLEWIWFQNKSVVLWEKEKPIRFDDDVFENFVRDLVDIHDRDLYPSDLQNINDILLCRHPSVDGFDKLDSTLQLFKCKSIKGIKYMKNLKRIVYYKDRWMANSYINFQNAGNNTELENIKELIALTDLKEVEIEQSKIDYIPDFSNLFSFQNLNLDGSNIVNIDGLNSCPSLEYIKIQGSKIREMGNFVPDNKIREMLLSRNNLKIVNLRNLYSLKFLYASENRIECIMNPEDTKALLSLSLGYNNISNIDFLRKMRNLKGLALSENPLEGIEALSFLINLKSLSLNDVNDIDINEILDMPFINNLDFEINISRSFKSYDEELEFLEKLKEVRNQQ